MGVFPVSVMCDAHICILVSVNCVTTPLKVTHVVYFIKRESKGKYVTTPPAVFDQHTICDRNTTGGTIVRTLETNIIIQTPRIMPPCLFKVQVDAVKKN